MNNKKLLVVVVYRPPSARLEEVSDGFEELMRGVTATGLDFICMGDFNFNLLDFRADNFDFLIS